MATAPRRLKDAPLLLANGGFAGAGPCLALGLCCLLGACTAPSRVSSLDRKSEPYDDFAYRRAYPEAAFDFQGWRKTLATTRQPVAERGPCESPTGTWTLQGPANVAGRVNALAVSPVDDLTVLAGFSGGGIFKTTDGGHQWRPVFDQQPELAIGDISYDPSQPNTVYAGTGDPNIPGIVFNGDGLYKSTDGGEQWTHLGLSQVGIISKVLVHPSQPATLYVAAMGNPYVRNNDRGVFKSTDGGNTWQQVLFVSNQAGASDLLMNPQQPNTLYAAFWDRIRSNTESTIYGPHARIYKTTDGGQTWNQLGGGLPTGIMGRVGLCMSATNPEKIYAVYVDTLSRPGGVYRSLNGGTSWSSISLNGLSNAYSDFGWYFGKLRVSPTNDDELYFLGVQLWRRVPATATWQSAAGGHTDSHDWIQTPSGRRYWANDGGVYYSPAGQSYYLKCVNLPTTQVYHTDFNPHQPEIFYVGAQDNGFQRGRADRMNNWETLFFADGFNAVFDPVDSNKYWLQTQNGAVHYTPTGGSTWQYGSDALETTDRVSWDAPFFMSAHAPPRLYSATFRAYVGENGAWNPISGDLTDGVIHGPRFHTITALQESPLQEGRLFAGTSDANAWMRTPDGHWENITANLPNRYITSIQGSTTQLNRVYVTHSGFRDNSGEPHVYCSVNNGQSWFSIASNLPNLPVSDLWILPGSNDQVLAVATDGGVYYTLNQGGSWDRLGDNLPLLPVFDLEYNPVKKLLMAATFARGVWTYPIDSLLLQGQPLVQIRGQVRTAEGVGVGGVAFGGSAGQSDLSGNYALTNLPGCSPALLEPLRNDQVLNGVSTYDLVLMSRHILGLQALENPYRMIAADVNRSGTITTFDIVTTRKIILGIDTAFAGNTSWRFVPAGFVFENPSNPFQAPFPEHLTLNPLGVDVEGLHWMGIKTGDVNGSALPFGAEGGDRAVGFLPIRFTDCFLPADTTIEVMLRAPLGEVLALQGQLAFDPGKAQLEAVEPLWDALEPDHFRIVNGGVRWAFHRATPGAAPPGWVRLRLRIKAAGRLSSLMWLDEKPVVPVVYTVDGRPLLPVLVPEEDGPARIQVWPNPLSRAQGGWVQLPGDGDHTIRFFSPDGRLLHQATGRTLIRLEAGAGLPEGPVFYQVSAAESGQVWTGTLIFY